MLLEIGGSHDALLAQVRQQLFAKVPNLSRFLHIRDILKQRFESISKRKDGLALFLLEGAAVKRGTRYVRS